MDEPRVYGPFISLQQAKQQGLKFYFTGIACKQGHIDLRVVSQHCCWICKKESGLKYYKKTNPFEHKYRPGFKLICPQCGGETIIGKLSFKEGSTCKIADSYKGPVCCSKACTDKFYRNKTDYNTRNKKRYKEDTEYRERLKKYGKKQREKDGHKEKQALYYKEWRVKNINKINDYKRDWHFNKYNTDLNYRLINQLRHRVNESVKRGLKSARTLKLIGTSLENLKVHLENHFDENMSWENWTSDGWHIDHIRPCATFNLEDEEQQYACFNWRNLQPLWGYLNAVKKDDYSQNDEIKWVKRMRELGYEGNLFLKFGENGT